ncbi:hypothetical protein O181_037379 [Austropuccinia psidii MF-1]|uniref:Uncharacterized protein n=1 Tax=Austropuccinia psidii MF-1 TaxID=1389203 RepID=A0A9Q3HCI0_9BASI|nr:hypothetical protein [Austropuccinia psidii MF-1]
MSSKVLTCHQASWAEFLSEFSFTITYLPGRLAALLDALSCWYTMYPEKGLDFIDKSPQTCYQILKQDRIQESRLFPIKIDILSYLVDQIQKDIWQDKDYKEVLKKPARGESVPDHCYETQAKFFYSKIE